MPAVETASKPTVTKAGFSTTISQADLAKWTGTSRNDIATMMNEAGIVLGKAGYPLFKSMKEVVTRKAGSAGRQAAAEKKLLADAEWTDVRRMRDAGELVLAADAGALAAKLAEITSNVIDGFGLERERRNDLMEQLRDAVRAGMVADDDEEEEGEG